jgi:hypothetical protein
MAAARPRAPLDDEHADLVEVPAAVVCAGCGGGECPGCVDDIAEPTESGVVLFVPWERPAAGLWARLWGTTRASTQGAEAFFVALPAGPLWPALRFALLAEAIAVGSSVAAYVVLGLAIFAAFFPQMTRLAIVDPFWLALIGRVMAVAWVSFVAVLVGAHTLHAVTLDLMARRAGAPGALVRALRFGLYATGWDVATSPFGLTILLGSRGFAGVLEARTHAFKTPGRATAAMLKGLYQLEGELAVRVRVRAMALTMAVSVVAIALACLAVVLAV